MFFERHMESIIELFIPDVTEPKKVQEMIPLCKKYIRRLDVSQLLPPVKEPQKEEEEYGSELASENEYDGPSMDHFDFNILLDKLTNLEELHLVYRVKQCGMNFEWKMFEMTDRDCESLAKALKSCRSLKVNMEPFCLFVCDYSALLGQFQSIIYRHFKVPDVTKQENCSWHYPSLKFTLCLHQRKDSRASGCNLNKSLFDTKVLSH